MSETAQTPAERRFLRPSVSHSTKRTMFTTRSLYNMTATVSDDDPAQNRRTRQEDLHPT
jgi:hypothetical protein